jgi:hypothetical protein
MFLDTAFSSALVERVRTSGTNGFPQTAEQAPQVANLHEIP